MKHAAVKIDDANAVWKAAVTKLVAEFKHGDVVTRAWFCDAFGIEYPSVTSVKALRKIDFTLFGMQAQLTDLLLHEHKMALRSLGNGEWEIVPPNEQAAYAQERTATAAMRAFAKGREIIECTKTDELTPAEMKARTDTLARLWSLEHMMRKRLAPVVVVVAEELPEPEGDGEE